MKNKYIIEGHKKVNKKFVRLQENTKYDSLVEARKRAEELRQAGWTVYITTDNPNDIININI